MTQTAQPLADVASNEDDLLFASSPCESAAPTPKTPADRFATALDLITMNDEDESFIIDELRAVGVDLSAPQSLVASERQAAASQFLRRAARHRTRLATLEDARDVEIALIQQHYAEQIGREQQQIMRYESAVEILAELAALAGDYGKKKSASTPYGTFGFREQRESYELADREKLLTYAKEKAPEFVKAELVMPLAEAREYFTDAELTERQALDVQWGEFKKTLDDREDELLPPGVSIKPGSRTYFAKPAVSSLDGLQVRA